MIRRKWHELFGHPKPFARLEDWRKALDRGNKIMWERCRCGLTRSVSAHEVWVILVWEPIIGNAYRTNLIFTKLFDRRYGKETIHIPKVGDYRT